MTLVCFIIVFACSTLLNENDLKIVFSGFWNNIGALTPVSVMHYLLKIFVTVKVPYLLGSCCN